MAELKSLNGLKSDLIKVGHMLKIFVSAHTVVSGDTLSVLAKKYGTTVTELKSLNGLKGDLIKVGQVLKLPAKYCQQLVLQNEQSLTFQNFAYEISLSDGSIFSGHTDENGCTGVLVMDKSSSVKSIKIFTDFQGCCATHSQLDDVLFAARNFYEYFDYVELHNPNFKLDNTNINQVILRLKPKSRGLTKGEVAYLTSIFGNSLNYEAVKIHRGRYLPGQKEYIAMTPNGEAYFPPSMNPATEIYKDDFSVEPDPFFKHLFVHEMFHVWQYQRGYNLRVQGLKILSQKGYAKATGEFPVTLAYNYKHLLGLRKHFSEFNMEQQAEMIADHYVPSYAPIYKKDINRFELQKLIRYFELDRNNTSKTLLPKTDDINKTVRNK